MLRRSKIIFMFAVLVAVLWGCASTSHKMNNLRLGMTKAEVISALGQPTSTSASEGTEYLVYKLRDRFNPDFMEPDLYEKDYFVRLRDGKVDSFGQVGDFDSTKIPESKHTLDVNIK